jgi:HlyD family secretion protein
MKRLLWILPLIVIGGGAWWVQTLRNAPPEVAFTKAVRERLVSTLRTNGKVEPLEWRDIRAEREGLVSRLAVAPGQPVARNAVILEFDSTEARAALAAAQSSAAQARIELDVVRAGGRTRDLAELSASMEKLKVDLSIARKEADALRRLVEKKAATQREAEQAEERVTQIQAEIAALEKRRASLVGQADQALAEAKLRDAENSAALALRRIERSAVRAPLAGVVYQLDARTGAYLRPGDLVGRIGVLDRVRVIVYVDEPELGSVRTGLPVTITWDALPGKQWLGTVEKLPTQIVPLGSRQVGEVHCIIANEDGRLLPSTNINAEIRLNVVENAVAIPKEVLRRERDVSGVYLLNGAVVAWRPVRLGVASLTHIQVVEGLREGDLVALPTDTPLRDGTAVRPKINP